MTTKGREGNMDRDHFNDLRAPRFFGAPLSLSLDENKGRMQRRRSGWKKRGRKYLWQHGSARDLPGTKRGDLGWTYSHEGTFRNAGTSEGILNLRHSGWFRDSDGSSGELYSGNVFQLPSRRRSTGARPGKVFLAAVYCNTNDHFLIVHNTFRSVEDAARCADQHAETMAEEEREYDEVWQAAQRCIGYMDNVKEIQGKIDSLAGIIEDLERRRDAEERKISDTEERFGDHPGWADAIIG
jgi:hypothetical protein